MLRKALLYSEHSIIGFPREGTLAGLGQDNLRPRYNGSWEAVPPDPFTAGEIMGQKKAFLLSLVGASPSSYITSLESQHSSQRYWKQNKSFH